MGLIKHFSFLTLPRTDQDIRDTDKKMYSPLIIYRNDSFFYTKQEAGPQFSDTEPIASISKLFSKKNNQLN
jgi:hypothetical protein